MAGPALQITGLAKEFAETRALDDVSFEVAPGSVHALLGGNGSGKSTLIKILAGVYEADAGVVSLAGRPIEAAKITPSTARELGLRFVHQDTGVFNELTIAENIALINGFGAGARVPWSQLRRRTVELLERFQIEARPEQPISDLRPADQTMVAIARALEDDGEGLSTLVLDEPTASLPRAEVELLLKAVRQCAAAGQTILFVSHRIDEVLMIADAVTVLRDGRKVFAGEAEGLTEEKLIGEIVGRPLQAVFPRPPAAAETRPPVLEAKGLCGGPVRDASFTVAAGEVVGLAGLLGSGRTELLQMAFGSERVERGGMTLRGKPYSPRSSGEAMRHGVAYVPEHRGTEAAFLDLTLRENLSVADLGRYWHGTFSHRSEKADAGRDIERFAIRAPGDQATFASLSGGNQQKAILARWLRLEPALLLLDEPTHGVDVGARADVFALIDEAVERGLAVLLVSSDFEELARVTDRVLIIRDGCLVSEHRADDLDAQAITELVYAGAVAA